MKTSVLIVDDSLTVRMDLKEAFEAAGFRSLLCASARETRQALTRERIALVVLDVLLPDGDGLELLQEIKAALGDTPVLLLSTEADVKDRVRGLRVGADDYVGKPYDAAYVIARALELVRRREGRLRDVGTSVLVVDDSSTFRERLREALEAAGYTVFTAETGEEGLLIAASQRPSVLMVDEQMPGIDGPTVIRRIRLDAALRGMPCILVTASEDRHAELRALDAGADAFVRKAEDLPVILARLKAVFRRSLETEPGESLMGPKRILAVDDSLTYLEELASTLRGEGYDVVLAHSGEEALEMLAAQIVDCVLLDVLMPGLDGHEVCRRIKASSVVRDIPLIMLTALENQSAMIESLASGADDFISKTGELEVLKARVRSQLRRKQFEDEHRRVRDRLLRSELEATEERSARRIAEARAIYVEELERKNRELETFSYSVSHDLRAPLRAIDGFSKILLEDFGGRLDDAGRGYLKRVCDAARRMDELIEGLLQLSRLTQGELNRSRVDVGALARKVADELAVRDPERRVSLVIADGLWVEADRRLLRALLDNLMGNAWKFTAKVEGARIEVGSVPHDGGSACFVRDNGAGFNMEHAGKLFTPFARMHSQAEFPGTGIGLATVHRIAERHGGRCWVEAAEGKGATFFFTLAPRQTPAA
jgi:two-component system NtrC family sensor kinase